MLHEGLGIVAEDCKDKRKAMETKFIASSDLLTFREELKDRSQYKRGKDGFERPLYVSPLTWEQVEMIVNELIARRHEDRKKNGN